MKTILSVILIIFTFCPSFSQIPTGYYNGTDGLTGVILKQTLNNIIKGHRQYEYTADTTDVWDILKDTDRDTLNSNNVISLYTGWSIEASQEYNSGNGWTREHVWSKSHGNFGTTIGAGTDVHHLRPEDVSVNSAKNNRDFDQGGTPYLDGDIPTGCYTTTYTWEPRNEVKGDVARMIFYMATRYLGENGEPNLTILDTINTSPANEPFYGKLSTLLLWNEQDPVSNWEKRRNDMIYTKYQHNRNPFIDHPEFAAKIWGSTNKPTFNSETFDYCNATGVYTNNTFTGNYGINWSFIAARDARDYPINSKGLILRGLSYSSSCTSDSIHEGIAEISIKLKKAFTGAGNRQVEILINNNSIGFSPEFDDTLVHTLTKTIINYSGKFVIKIRNTKDKQVVIDGISWKNFSYWLGYSHNWLDPNNWSSKIIPRSTTNVFIPDYPPGGMFPEVH